MVKLVQFLFYYLIILYNIYQFSIHYYFFVDENPINGISYYRLNEVDLDANEIFSQVISVELSIANSITVKTFPEINNGQINIELTDQNDETVAIEIYDVLGRMVFSEIELLTSGKKELSVDAANFSQGIYLLSVGKGEEKKLVKFVY